MPNTGWPILSCHSALDRRAYIRTVSKIWGKRVKLISVLATLGIILFTSQAAYSGNAAPYTEEAYQAVERGYKQIGELRYQTDASKADRYKAMIEHSRKAFAAAGYDYDATLRRILDDVINHPDQIRHRNPPMVFSVNLMALGMMMGDCYREAIDCPAFFPADIATAIRKAMPPDLFRHDRK